MTYGFSIKVQSCYDHVVTVFISTITFSIGTFSFKQASGNLIAPGLLRSITYQRSFSCYCKSLMTSHQMFWFMGVSSWDESSNNSYHEGKTNCIQSVRLYELRSYQHFAIGILMNIWVCSWNHSRRTYDGTFDNESVLSIRLASSRS